MVQREAAAAAPGIVEAIAKLAEIPPPRKAAPRPLQVSESLRRTIAKVFEPGPTASAPSPGARRTVRKSRDAITFAELRRRVDALKIGDKL